MKISLSCKEIAGENLLADLNRQICDANENAVRLWDGKKWYEIEFSTCNTDGKIIQWIDCLTRQDWITVKHIELFIQKALTKRFDPTKKGIIFKVHRKELV